MKKPIVLQNLKSRILRRVYGVWFWKYEVPLMIIEVAVLIVALSFFGHYVFIEKVVANTLTASLGNPFKVVVYLLAAFAKTRTIIKLIVIVFGAALLLFLKDVNKSLISYASMKRHQLFPKKIQ